MQHLIKLWIFLAVLLPAIVGILLIFNPEMVLSADSSLIKAARVIGLRNIIFSVVLLLAFFAKQTTAVGYLLVMRGLTEIVDATLYLVDGKFSAVVFPFFASLVSFTIAYYLIFKKNILSKN